MVFVDVRSERPPDVSFSCLEGDDRGGGALLSDARIGTDFAGDFGSILTLVARNEGVESVDGFGFVLTTGVFAEAALTGVVLFSCLNEFGGLPTGRGIDIGGRIAGGGGLRGDM